MSIKYPPGFLDWVAQVYGDDERDGILRRGIDDKRIRDDLHAFEGGYASGQKSKWLAYPENYPNKHGDYFVLYEGKRPSVLRWFSEERWEDGQKPTHFLLIELPDQSVSKEVK